MTMQQTEWLVYEGEDYPLLDRPLESCLEPTVYAKVQWLIHQAGMRNTSLHRNYLGYWRIHDASLLLDDVEIPCEEALASAPSSMPHRGLVWLFPSSPAPAARLANPCHTY